MTFRRPSSSKKGMGCFILFALPFAGVGVAMLVLLAWTLLEWSAVRRWEAVPARIVRAELETHLSDDSTSYKATAEYRYEFGGKTYTGTRVALHGGSDNIGSFQKTVHKELKRHEKSGRPFRCFVNPRRPSEAILYRQLRWEMMAFYTLFALVFGGFGFALLFGCLYGYRKLRAEENLAAIHPEEPWRWREDWAKGEVRSSGKALLLGVWGFAVLWNLISAPAVFLLPSEVIGKNNLLALLGLIFPVVGLGLLIVAVYLLLRWRKYGDAVFQMVSVPGVIGGPLSGVIRTSARVRPDDGFLVTLSCIQKRTSGSGDSKSTREITLWEDQRKIVRGLAEEDFSQSSIPVLFAVPYDARPSDPPGAEDPLLWRLEATAAVPGIDYAVSFEVPVFKTAESRADFKLDEAPIAPYTAPVDPDAELAAARVVRTVAPDGSARYIFPRARRWGVALSFTIFAAIWTGAIGLMLHFDAPILFPIVFGLFDVLILVGVADLWFHRGVVDVSPRGLSVAGGFLGLGRARMISVGEIASLRTRQSMQAGTRLYFDIVVHLADRKKVTAAKWIPGRRSAEALVQRWENELTT